MTTISVVSHGSVDGIPFGAARAEVRRVCGPEFREIRKTRTARNSMDDFGLFQVHYDADDRVEAIEFEEGPVIAVDGQVVFPSTLPELAALYPGGELDGESFIVRDRSLGFTVEDGLVVGVLAGRRGYYD